MAEYASGGGGAEPRSLDESDVREDRLRRLFAEWYRARVGKHEGGLRDGDTRFAELRDPHAGLVPLFDDAGLPTSVGPRGSGLVVGGAAVAGGEGVEEAPRLFRLREEERAAMVGAAAIVDAPTFRRSFDVFTEGVLRYLDSDGGGWDNVLVAGGCVLACLTHGSPASVAAQKARGTPETKAQGEGVPDQPQGTTGGNKLRRGEFHSGPYKDADIDIFLYGLNEEEATAKLLRIWNAVTEASPVPVTAFRTKNTITLVSRWPYKHVQIILRLYSSPAEVLLGFDVDCCAVGYDGTNVWASPRAVRAIASRCNRIDMSRRSPSYEVRLAKYADRGFEVVVPSLAGASVNPHLFESSFGRLQGLSRLLFLERFKDEPAREAYRANRSRARGRPADSGVSFWDLLAADIAQRQGSARRTRHPRRASRQQRWQYRGAVSMKLELSSSESDDSQSESDSEDEDVEGKHHSNYATVFLPWEEGWDGEKLARFMYDKDQILNAEWFAPGRGYHTHPCFFGTMHEVIRDCCPDCPPMPEAGALGDDGEDGSGGQKAKRTATEEDPWVRGPLTWIVDDPGRQSIGSFNPITDGDWTGSAVLPAGAHEMFSGAAQGDLRTVQRFLKELGDAAKAARDPCGRSLLHIAASTGNAELASIALRNGVSPAAKLADGKTALHLAAAAGHADVVSVILELHKEAGPTESAVATAGQRSDADDGPFDIDATDFDVQMTPLHFAILLGHTDTACALLRGGANCNALYRRDSMVAATPNSAKWLASVPLLALAALCGDPEAARTIAMELLAHGCRVDQFDFYLRTPIHLCAAVPGSGTAVLEAMLEAEPDLVGKHVNDVAWFPACQRFLTPLAAAAFVGSLASLRLLLDKGKAAVEVLDRHCDRIRRMYGAGQVSTHLVPAPFAVHGDSGTTLAASSGGYAYTNHTSSLGGTRYVPQPLECAARSGSLAAVNLLLSAGGLVPIRWPLLRHDLRGPFANLPTPDARLINAVEGSLKTSLSLVRATKGRVVSERALHRHVDSPSLQTGAQEARFALRKFARQRDLLQHMSYYTLHHFGPTTMMEFLEIDTFIPYAAVDYLKGATANDAGASDDSVSTDDPVEYLRPVHTSVVNRHSSVCDVGRRLGHLGGWEFVLGSYHALSRRYRALTVALAGLFGLLTAPFAVLAWTIDPTEQDDTSSIQLFGIVGGIMLLAGLPLIASTARVLVGTRTLQQTHWTLAYVVVWGFGIWATISYAMGLVAQDPATWTSAVDTSETSVGDGDDEEPIRPLFPVFAALQPAGLSLVLVIALFVTGCCSCTRVDRAASVDFEWPKPRRRACRPPLRGCCRAFGTMLCSRVHGRCCFPCRFGCRHIYAACASIAARPNFFILSEACALAVYDASLWESDGMAGRRRRRPRRRRKHVAIHSTVDLEQRMQRYRSQRYMQPGERIIPESERAAYCQLFGAAWMGDDATIRRLADDRKVLMCVRDNTGYTPLSLAALKGHARCVDAILTCAREQYSRLGLKQTSAAREAAALDSARRRAKNGQFGAAAAKRGASTASLLLRNGDLLSGMQGGIKPGALLGPGNSAASARPAPIDPNRALLAANVSQTETVDRGRGPASEAAPADDDSDAASDGTGDGVVSAPSAPAVRPPPAAALLRHLCSLPLRFLLPKSTLCDSTMLYVSLEGSPLTLAALRDHAETTATLARHMRLDDEADGNADTPTIAEELLSALPSARSSWQAPDLQWFTVPMVCAYTGAREGLMALLRTTGGANGDKLLREFGVEPRLQLVDSRAERTEAAHKRHAAGPGGSAYPGLLVGGGVNEEWAAEFKRSTVVLSRPNGATPLHVAAFAGQLHVIRALLGNEGISAAEQFLESSCARAHVDRTTLPTAAQTARALYGIECVDDQGCTALHWAVLGNQPRAIECIVQCVRQQQGVGRVAGEDSDEAGGAGAAESKGTEDFPSTTRASSLTRSVLEVPPPEPGAVANMKISKRLHRKFGGMTALHLAVHHDSMTCIHALVSLPEIDLLATDSLGRTALHAAVALRHVNALAELLRCVPRELMYEVVNAPTSDAQAQSAIMMCGSHVAMWKLFLSLPSLEVDVRDGMGNSLAHVAAATGDALVVDAVERRLASAGGGTADQWRRENYVGMTPLDLAVAARLGHLPEVPAMHLHWRDERFVSLRQRQIRDHSRHGAAMEAVRAAARRAGPRIVASVREMHAASQADADAARKSAAEKALDAAKSEAGQLLADSPGNDGPPISKNHWSGCRFVSTYLVEDGGSGSEPAAATGKRKQE